MRHLFMKTFRRIVSDIIITAAIIVLAVSAYNLYKIFSEYSAAEKEYSEISDRVSKKKDEEKKEEEEDPCPISIDFEELKKINPDVVGWIYCEDTVIDYPVLKGKDNDQYLHHTMEGQYNSSGSIFMDYMNEPDLSSINTILYGHHMKNGSMFASLKKYNDQEYYEEHPVIWYLTPEKNYKLNVFAGFVERYDSPIYGIFTDRKELTDYLNASRDKSRIELPEELSLLKNEDIGHIMVLSTCDYSFDNARYILLCVYDKEEDIPSGQKTEVPEDDFPEK